MYVSSIFCLREGGSFKMGVCSDWSSGGFCQRYVVGICLMCRLMVLVLVMQSCMYVCMYLGQPDGYGDLGKWCSST